MLQRLGSIVGGLFALSAAFLAGAVLLDVVYASLLRQTAVELGFTAVFEVVSDILLILVIWVGASGLAAVLLHWRQPAVRNLYAASLFIVGLELVGPFFLLPVLATAPDSLVRVLGPVLRLVPIVLASITALAAFHTNRTKGEIT